MGLHSVSGRSDMLAAMLELNESEIYLPRLDLSISLSFVFQLVPSFRWCRALYGLLGFSWLAAGQQAGIC